MLSRRERGREPRRTVDRAELGERIVGWSGSTGSAVRNASINLEFGDQSPFAAKSCSAFPARTTSDMLAVLAVFADDSGISEAEAVRFQEICAELSASVADEGTGSALAGRRLQDQILSRVLPHDPKSAAACFPIGVVAVRVPDLAEFKSETARALVRATDSVVQLDNGAFVFVLQRASQASVSAVIERIKSACGERGCSPTFESAILTELSERTVGDVSNVIATLNPTYLGQVSTKLH